MKIKFDPNNPIIKLCMTGMGLRKVKTVMKHLRCFKSMEETRDDYERFIYPIFGTYSKEYYRS